jgi:hypothetical protein
MIAQWTDASTGKEAGFTNRPAYPSTYKNLRRHPEAEQGIWRGASVVIVRAGSFALSGSG